MQIQTIVRATFPNSDFSPGPQDNSRCEGSLSSGDDLACKWQRVSEILETAGQDLDPEVVLPPLMEVSHPMKFALFPMGSFTIRAITSVIFGDVTVKREDYSWRNCANWCKVLQERSKHNEQYC